MSLAVEFNRAVGLAALGNAAWVLFLVFLAFATPGRRTIQRLVDRSDETAPPRLRPG